MRLFSRHEGDVTHALLTPLLMSVLFGMAAGAVGMLLVSAFLLPAQTGIVSGTARGGSVLIPEEAAPTTEYARSAAYFYDASAVARLTANGALKTLVPADAFGAGFALTADGWLVAHASSFPKGRHPADSYALIAGRTYKVTSAVSDAYTGLVFLRIDAAGLPVAPFGSAGDLLAGGSAFAFDAFGGFHRAGVTAYDDQAVTGANDLNWSSERLQSVVHLSGADGLLPGSMLLSRKGEVVAVLAGTDAEGAYAVPYDAFRHVIGSVLKDGKPQRAYLGVRYYDLSRFMGGSGQPQRGALIAAPADGHVSAVAPRSPAEAAGVQAGDVIVSVNGEDVSAKSALSDLLDEYAPGDAVELALTRGGKDMRVTAVLGTAPTQK
ncbi:MAG: hypothetical protein RLZZ324_862 [Candidatus Parcubacteria bacterium]|jgi:hypothetical protein